MAHYLSDLCGRTIAAYAGLMIRKAVRLTSRITALSILVALSMAPAHAARKRTRHPRAPRYATLGAVRTVPYSVAGDPAGALTGEASLRVRPIVVEGRIKGWVTGSVHPITPDTFAAQSAVRMNNSLPGSTHVSWVWQRGPWLLVHSEGARVDVLRFPDYDPSVSRVVWFRNYAAYCGVNSSGKHLYAVVDQVGVHRPVISRELGAWNVGSPAGSACAPPQWQVSPLAVSFAPTGSAETTYDLFPAASSSSTPVESAASVAAAPVSAQ